DADARPVTPRRAGGRRAGGPGREYPRRRRPGTGHLGRSPPARAHRVRPPPSPWAPTWSDPAETPGIITPFMILYALHDALIKPMPGNPMTPSRAESWSAAKDGLSYEFPLRS